MSSGWTIRKSGIEPIVGTVRQPPAQTDPAPTVSLSGQRRVRRENIERILKAAEFVFAQVGSAGATMAEIADRAGLPKGNLHYYFRTKEDLYRAVLDNVLRMWLAPVEAIQPDADPATALTEYVVAKMRVSRTRPNASKVFASEVLHGGAQIQGFLSNDLRGLLDRKAAVLDGWVARGLMAPVEPRQFFFMIWAVTQHYADFDLQVRTLLGQKKLSREDFDRMTAEVVCLVLRAAGLSEAADRARIAGR